MSILFVLVPLGLVLLALAIAAFFWAVGSGQFDDLDRPGTLVLFDDEPSVNSASTASRAAGSSGATPRQMVAKAGRQ